MQCSKCFRFNSLKRIDSVGVDYNTKKLYYECSECGNLEVKIVDINKPILNAERFAEKPDLWWEKLPNKEPLIDKSKTDPCESFLDGYKVVVDIYRDVYRDVIESIDDEDTI